MRLSNHLIQRSARAVYILLFVTALSVLGVMVYYHQLQEEKAQPRGNDILLGPFIYDPSSTP